MEHLECKQRCLTSSKSGMKKSEISNISLTLYALAKYSAWH